nr:hypothetical protein [uncultured Albidiferax sp.]
MATTNVCSLPMCTKLEILAILRGVWGPFCHETRPGLSISTLKHRRRQGVQKQAALFPLLCPMCDGQMRLIAFVTEGAHR